MRRLKAGTCLLFLTPLLIGGCVAYEGTNQYYLTGRLVDALTGEPLAGAHVVGLPYMEAEGTHDPQWLAKVHGDMVTDTSHADSRHSAKYVTDENGRFEVVMGALFGDLGLIFLPPPHPAPPPLDGATLYVRTEGVWRRLVVPLTKAQQKRKAEYERWVDAGTVKLDRSAP